MVRETYSKPEFGFQEMALFERVADKCWGTSQVWLDANGDSQATAGLDINLTTSGGCQGANSAKEMNKAIASANDILSAFNDSECNYELLKGFNGTDMLYEYAVANEVKSFGLIEATAEPNWANTQATPGGGIIVIGS